jgi:hypothetical protein
VSVGTAPAPPVEFAGRRTERAGTAGPEAVLSRREAALRSAAATCLAGIALVQAIELPSVLARGGRFAVLSLAAMALCLGAGFALAAAPARIARQLWGVVGATAVLVLAGWAAPHAFAVPGLADHQGHWAAMPGTLCGALAASCLVLAAVGVPPTRASARALATTVAVLVALAPGAGTLLVALGPGPAGGETTLVSGGHVHAPAGLDETRIQFQPIAGGRGGHFVYRASATPRQTALGVAVLLAAALVFVSGAVAHLRRRSAPLAPADR